MRRRVLVSSVQRLLRDDEQFVEAAFMWRHQPWMIATASAVAATVFTAASVLSLGSNGSRLGIALAVALLVSVLRTDYRVLALTSAPRRILFRASRVRQVAVAAIAELEPGAEIEVMTSNVVLTDWLVAGERYTVPKSSQAAMTRLAGE